MKAESEKREKENPSGALLAASSVRMLSGTLNASPWQISSSQSAPSGDDIK
ncbi:MAG: hypothetical protein ABJX82_08015 [Paracoccaceae bacterium]